MIKINLLWKFIVLLTDIYLIFDLIQWKYGNFKPLNLLFSYTNPWKIKLIEQLNWLVINGFNFYYKHMFLVKKLDQIIWV